MEDDAATELFQWWEDVATDGIKSRVVLVPAPSGWGRTTLLDRFTAAVLDAVPFSVVLRMDGRKAPAGPGPTAAWLAKHADDDRLVELVRRALGLNTAEGAALLAAGVAGQTVAPLLGGPLGLALQVGLGANLVLRQHLFPDPEALAGRVAARVSRASIEVPFVVVMDDADVLDPGICDAFLSGLVDRQHGQVLAVVAVDPASELWVRMRSPERYGPAGDRVRSVEILDAAMGPTDRRRICLESTAGWPAAAVDRLVGRTRTYTEVWAVTGVSGAQDVPVAADPVAAVDTLISAVLPAPVASDAALVVAWCGGALHERQLVAALEVLRPAGTPISQGDGPASTASAVGGIGPGVKQDAEVVRLERPGDLASLMQILPARLDQTRRRRMAEQIGQVAAAVVATSPDPLAKLAALRPIPVLLHGDTPDLTTSSETLTLCADLVDLLRSLSDVSAARKVATDCLALADRHEVSGLAVDRLAAASLSLRWWSCDRDGSVEPATGDDAGALAARISDPDNIALFGLEARLWAAIMRLQDPASRVEGIALADRLLPLLDPAALGRIGLTWRLQLGVALARTGALEITGFALRPLLNLEEGDELRSAAEAVATTMGSAVGDSLLAIAALEAELAATPPAAADERLRLRCALSHLHAGVGAWRSAAH